MRQAVMLIVFLGLVGAVAASGATFQPGAWYQALAKPAWTPPSWLFGPVWTTLYVLIAIAGWLVWREQGVGLALGLWALQLVLNGAWSWLMFGQRQIGWALADILVLLATILAFIAAAWPVSRAAALLFVPYAAWVAFATALNFSIWRLNASG